MKIPPHQTMIAGPCSAETQQQVLTTAERISKIDSSIIYRAGIWKPRTNPDSFQGIGNIGLEWLQEVKATYGLKTATEIATPEHAEACLKAGIDVLWIGARTTVNPFSVQAIADALEGVDVPVMVKNPIHSDIQLWIGAFERLKKAGITQLSAIHRGFHHPENPLFRNVPKWELVDQFKKVAPEIPIICDPSHITGNSLLVPTIAEEAVKRNFDGLMIETHNRPTTALSDKAQQLRPKQLKALVNYLYSPSQDLSDLRQEIDQTDEHLISLLARRMSISGKIALSKRKDEIEIIQPDRWKKVQEKNAELAKNHELNSTFVNELYELIHEASIEQQRMLR